MAVLAITEKPSVALDIAHILGGFEKKDGYLESKEIVITWALGHLIELAKPQDYDPCLEKWNIQDLPVIPAQFMLVPRKPTRKQLNIIKKLIYRRDVTRLINACDAGREGELIFRYILQYLDCRKPHDRLWLSETTAHSVRAAFSKLRSSAEMENLAKAAVARSQADWIVGINATRAYTCQYGEKMTVGRVQTPTLALIVERERKIEAFVPEPYYELQAVFLNRGQSYSGTWFHDKQDRFDAREEPELILNRLLPGIDGVVTRTEHKEVQELPPHLYNLNDLQKDANKRLGLTAEQTLNIAQKLYESKLITYPRTDSRYLTSSMAATLPERLNALRDTELGDFLKNVNPGIPDKRYVDDSKVNDHTAILITSVPPNMSVLSENERQVYMLVARRLLAAFFPAAKYLQKVLITVVSGETFLTKGRVVMDPGWKVLMSSADSDDNDHLTELPDIKQGETVTLTDIKIENKETRPPKRYTEADLLAAMENAGRIIEDKNLREAIQGKGLGTPATRAAVIEKLVEVEYIIRQKKVLIPTGKGKRLIEIVVPQLKDPEMTAEWEQKLLEIEQGRYHSKPFLDGIKDLTRLMVNELKAREPVVKKREVVVLGNCPLCGKPVVQNQKAYGCSGWREGCSFVIWKSISGKTISQANARRLLQKSRSDLIKGFKSRKGNEFDAYLIIKDGKVVFEFPQERGLKRS